MKELLREFIRNVLLEKGETQLKKWIEPDTLPATLANLGIIVVPRGKREIDEPLGFGAFSMVFEATWKGHRVAVKVTEFSQEISALEMIEEIRSTAPKTVARHFVNVYDTGTFEHKGGSFHYAVTEFLVPVPRGKAVQLWGSAAIGDSSVKNSHIDIQRVFEEDPERLRHILGEYLTGDECRQLIDAIVSFLLDQFQRPKPLIHYSVPSTFISLLKDPTIKGEIKKLQSRQYDKDVEEMIKSAWDQIIRVLRGQTFPERSHEQDDPRVSTINDPQVKSLLHALKWLERNYEISWNDLHSDNVMMRPNTHELVVSDIGQFEEGGRSIGAET